MTATIDIHHIAHKRFQSSLDEDTLLMLDASGMYDDAFQGWLHHNCSCHIRGNAHAHCSKCIAYENEHAFISIDTLLYLAWCLFWAAMIFRPWEMVS